MDALFNIIAYSVGSLLLGIILTLAGVVLMFVLVKSWWRDATFTPVSFFVGALLFFLLAFQAVLFCGAVTVKTYCDDIEMALNGMVAGVPADMELSQEDSQRLLNEISGEWPLVGYYVGQADFRGHTSATIAASMSCELRSYMNWFMFRRVGWSLLFVVSGAFLIIKSISGRYGGRRAVSQRVGRRGSGPVPRHRRPRVSAGRRR